MTDQQIQQGQQPGQQTNDQQASQQQGQQETVDPWKGSELDDETKQFIGTKTPAQVARELRDAQRLIGKKTIGIPGKDSTPEEQRAFHQARGVPDSPEKYDLTATLDEIKAQMPEGFVYDEKREKQFREIAKAANLSNAEANEFAKRQVLAEFEQNKQQIIAQTQSNKQTEDLVAQNWGPDRQAKEQAANRFARHIGFDEDMLSVFMKAAGTKPEARFKLIDYFAEQGSLLKEGGGPGTMPGASPAASMSPEQAAIAKENFLNQGDNRAAYMDGSHPNHKAVTAQVTQYLMVGRSK